MFKQLSLLVVFLFLVGVSFATDPIGTTQVGAITYYAQIGYSTPGFSQVIVQISAPYVNPSNCTPNYTAYGTIPGDAGLQAALLAAQLSGKQVALTVQGCTNGRPQIFSVYLH